MFYLQTCCDTFREHFCSGKCRVTHSNNSSTTYIDYTLCSTATASTNISNYFCALWPKRRVELFTNVGEIWQSSPHRIFISSFASCFYYYLAGLQSILMVNWPIHSSHLWSFPQGFSFRKSKISISQITESLAYFHFANYRFLFCKSLAVIFPFRKLLQARKSMTVS